MTDPIIFISRNRIKEGKSEEFKRHYQDSISPTVAAKPGTLVQLGYADEQATEFTVIRVFPSADALDMQIQGADERSKKTYTFIEPTSIEIFGTPNAATLEKMKAIAGTGVLVKICPIYMGGFSR